MRTAWHATACWPARPWPPGTASRARPGKGRVGRDALGPGARCHRPAAAEQLALAVRGHACVAGQLPCHNAPPFPLLPRRWGQYCRFALPSVAMLCCEWSTFEVRCHDRLRFCFGFANLSGATGYRGTAVPGTVVRVPGMVLWYALARPRGHRGRALACSQRLRFRRRFRQAEREKGETTPQGAGARSSAAAARATNPGACPPCCQVMVLMSGLLPDPAVSVSAMGLAINTSGKRCGVHTHPLVRASRVATRACLAPPGDRRAFAAASAGARLAQRWTTRKVPPHPGRCTRAAHAGLSYMAVTGLACATSVRAGHALGAGRPGDARRATWTAWRLTMCQQVSWLRSSC